MTTDTSRFAPGATAVRRDVLGSRVWSAHPNRVVSDDGAVLELAYWPGIRSLAPTTWSTALRTGDDGVRKQGLRNLAAGDWQLDLWTWEQTTLLSRFTADEYFSVHAFRDASTGDPLRLYVNFELPYTRTAIGIDTFDLFVDLVIEPDLSSYRWKDTDEYAQARRLGLIDDALHARVGTARERAVGQLQDRATPFTGTWPTWSPDPAWPLPQLPEGAGDYGTGGVRG